MNVSQPFEKDILTEEEMFQVAIGSHLDHLYNHMLNYGWLKDDQ